MVEKEVKKIKFWNPTEGIIDLFPLEEKYEERRKRYDSILRLPIHYGGLYSFNLQSFRCHSTDGYGLVNLKSIKLCPACEVFFLDILLDEYYESLLGVTTYGGEL